MEYDERCRCAECARKRMIVRFQTGEDDPAEQQSRALFMLRRCVDYLEPRVGHIPESRGFALLNELKEFLK